MLTERDYVILAGLLRFTVLNNVHIALLTGDHNLDQLNSRLRKLWDHCIINRLDFGDKLTFRSGSPRTVYTLGQQGAKALEERGHKLPAGKGWNYVTEARGGVRGLFMLEHELGANGTMIRLEQALRERPDVSELWNAEELVARAPIATQDARRPLSIPTTYEWNDNELYERQTIPDGVVGFQAGRHSTMLFLEYDREMVIVGKDPKRPSILQKIASYNDIFASNTVSQRFGLAGGRVLFVTEGTDEHLAKMASACIDYRRSNRRQVNQFSFLFARYADYLEQGPLGKIWLNGDGKLTSLLKPLPS